MDYVDRTRALVPLQVYAVWSSNMSVQLSQRSANLLENAELVINNQLVRFTEKKGNWQAFARHGEDDTGYALWDGGVVLALYLDRCLGSSFLRHISAIELGCGTGVAGISLVFMIDIA